MVLQTKIDSGWWFGSCTATFTVVVGAPRPCPSVLPKINGSSADTVPVDAPGPIVMDGSGSCSTDGQYFLSIRLSDASWGHQSSELARWLKSSDFAAYGPISKFNVKKWAEDNYVQFVPGQYYLVKLAVGTPSPGKNARNYFPSNSNQPQHQHPTHPRAASR